jgi:hypothetical protein
MRQGHWETLGHNANTRVGCQRITSELSPNRLYFLMLLLFFLRFPLFYLVFLIFLLLLSYLYSYCLHFPSFSCATSHCSPPNYFLCPFSSTIYPWLHLPALTFSYLLLGYLSLLHN